MLTAPRDKQLYTLILEGLANKEIAVRMGLTHATVKTYVRDLYKKLDVKSREELMALEIRRLKPEAPKVPEGKK